MIEGLVVVDVVNGLIQYAAGFKKIFKNSSAMRWENKSPKEALVLGGFNR